MYACTDWPLTLFTEHRITYIGTSSSALYSQVPPCTGEWEKEFGDNNNRRRQSER